VSGYVSGCSSIVALALAIVSLSVSVCVSVCSCAHRPEVGGPVVLLLERNGEEGVFYTVPVCTGITEHAPRVSCFHYVDKAQKQYLDA